MNKPSIMTDDWWLESWAAITAVIQLPKHRLEQIKGIHSNNMTTHFKETNHSLINNIKLNFNFPSNISNMNLQ